MPVFKVLVTFELVKYILSTCCCPRGDRVVSSIVRTSLIILTSLPYNFYLYYFYCLVTVVTACACCPASVLLYETVLLINGTWLLLWIVLAVVKMGWFLTIVVVVMGWTVATGIVGSIVVLVVYGILVLVVVLR